MPKSWNTPESSTHEKSTAAYYVYADGHSYWGLSLWKNNELPVPCTAEIHSSTDISEKQNFYTEFVENKRKEDEEKKKK